MSLLNENDVLVLIIDVQEKLVNAVFNRENIEKNSVILAKSSALLDIPVIVTEQYPKGLGSTIPSVKLSLGFKTQYFEKTAFSCMQIKEIAEAIKNLGKKQIIVLGIETHICVSQTVASLVNKGYEVFVVSDASGSRAEREHLAGLERIKSHGAQIVTTEIALFELLKGARHPKFREVQELIK